MNPRTETAPTFHSGVIPPPLAGMSNQLETVTRTLATLGDSLKAMSGLSLPQDALADLQRSYLQESTDLWNRSLQAGGASSPPADRRFAAAAWSAKPAAFMAEMYLLNSRTLMQMTDRLQGDAKTRERVRFAVQQWVDATSPSNFLALNPEVLRKAVESKGESLSKGLQQLLADLGRGHMSQTDESVFEVGRNVATSEGSIVFENELFQLIEYKPLTEQVYALPMLFVPPCINKFYILDLQPENSLIRYTVAQGHRVFVLSWRNADESIARFTWDQYIEDAVIRAIGLVQEISGSEKINTLGFCVGGTILSTALAVLASRGQKPAASLTLLTTLLDFSDTGVLDIFIDESMVKMREMTLGERSAGGGSLLKGQELATTFSFLRPNDLVWNYLVGNYLKGETPPAFDLLYWNSDSTNLPGPMYCWYLRNTYLENNLIVPDKMTVCGEPVDLSRIDAPTYVYASKEDHIVPWKGAYLNTGVLGGKVRFMLGASGHIAGVINPPASGKRSHWLYGDDTNAMPANASPADADSPADATPLPPEPDQWFSGAREQRGSWWPDWSGWLAPLSGDRIAAPAVPGSAHYPPLEAAPGRYVQAKA